MSSSFALYFFLICSTISWESFLISNLVATNVMARSSLTRTISYSISLLEAEKLRQITYSTSFPISDCMIRPTSESDALDAPSTWSVHHCFLGDLTGCVGFWGSSTLKSAITCHFNANLGWYLIMYSLNSMTHFNISLDRSDLCRVTRSG